MLNAAAHLIVSEITVIFNGNLADTADNLLPEALHNCTGEGEISY
jgi:hypothetical protein